MITCVHCGRPGFAHANVPNRCSDCQDKVYRGMQIRVPFCHVCGVDRCLHEEPLNRFGTVR